MEESKNESEKISKKRSSVQTLAQQPTITYDDFTQLQKEAEVSRNAEIIDYIDSQINQDKIQQANIVKKAEKLKEFIPEFDNIQITGSEYLSEVNGYSSISKGKGKDIFGVLGPTGYTKAQKNKIQTAIHYFRSMPEDNPIKQLIKSYQSDPDASDILRANQDERFKSQMYANYRISRYFNLDPSKPFFSRNLENTGLGRVVVELMNEEDDDDKFVVGYNRLFNILFETFIHLVLMALIFPSWPSFMETKNPISVYVGTYDAESGDANCLNFKLAEIENGTIIAGTLTANIRVYAPVTSASNDAKVAIEKFAKTNGSIIKINLANGKSFMCVSTGPNEAETFVLAGQYQYVRKYPFIDPRKGTLTVYEFNQLNTDFTGLTSDELTQPFWNSLKEKIPQGIQFSFQQSEMDPLNRQQSLLRTITGTAIALKNPRLASAADVDPYFVPGTESGDEGKEVDPDRGGGFFKSNRRTNKRPKTNKRRKSNKRRTNKRRNSNKRKTKRRI
jgi:hypothetical protein